MPNLYDLTDAAIPTQQAANPVDNTVAPVQDSVLDRIKNRLLGMNGEERYQTWPERLVREGLTAPGDVLAKTEPSTSESLIQPAMQTAALAGTGGLAGTGDSIPEVAFGMARFYHGGESPTSGGSRWLTPYENYARNYGVGNKEVHYADIPMSDVMEHGGYDEINNSFRNFNAPEEIAKQLSPLISKDITLGSAPFLRPALKYQGKIYKAPVGAVEHSDAIPAHLQDDFYKKAMSGEDINHYQFGFMNHKGQFLNREDALDYGIKEGLVDPSAGQYGVLTSTMLSDSSKPGVAIENNKKYKLVPVEGNPFNAAN